MPEPEFWIVLFASLVVGSFPACAGGAILIAGIHCKSNPLKIIGLLFLLLGLAVMTPMTLLLVMWMI